jgi:signal peptidase I
MRALVRRLERGFAIVGVLVCVYHLTMNVSPMASGSMSPTLIEGDIVVTEKVTELWRRPSRFEVLTFVTADGIQVMKRVAGLPGETVSLVDRELAVDGEVVAWPQGREPIRYFAYGNLSRGARAAAGRGYYVLGDDSQDSQDSRFEGPVLPEHVKGRAWLIVWPLSRAGFVR